MEGGGREQLKSTQRKREVTLSGMRDYSVITTMLFHSSCRMKISRLLRARLEGSPLISVEQTLTLGTSSYWKRQDVGAPRVKPLPSAALR